MSENGGGRGVEAIAIGIVLRQLVNQFPPRGARVVGEAVGDLPHVTFFRAQGVIGSRGGRAANERCRQKADTPKQGQSAYSERTAHDGIQNGRRTDTS